MQMYQSFILSWILYLAASQEIYENSSNICHDQRCHCFSTSITYKLNCNNAEMRHALANWPQEIKNRTFLKATFSYNNITTLEEMPPTDLIVWIALDHCGIKFLNPGIFVNMKNVEYVDLSFNLLTSEQISAEKFKGPYNKEKYEPINVNILNLAHNQIHSLPQNMFEHMPNLRKLILEGNQLKVLDIHTQAALSTLQHLEVLNLANNQLKILPNNALLNAKKTSRIRLLNLAKNNFTAVPTSVLDIRKTLEILILDENPLDEISEKSFLGMYNIIELSLNNLPYLKIIKNDAFIQLMKLRKLELSRNNLLENIEPKAFRDNQTLNELLLNGNNLIIIDSNLLKWESVMIFEMFNNPLLCSCHLYKLTQRLVKTVTISNAGLHCFQPNGLSHLVNDLNQSICECQSSYLKDEHFTKFRTFAILRVSTVTTSILLIMLFIACVTVSFVKYKKYGAVFTRNLLFWRNPLDTSTILFSSVSERL